MDQHTAGWGGLRTALLKRYAAELPPPRQVLCIGHSFVTRVQSFLTQHDSRGLYLPEEQYTMHYRGQGGAHIADLSRLMSDYLFSVHSAELPPPTVIVIDIGTSWEQDANPLLGKCDDRG